MVITVSASAAAGRLAKNGWKHSPMSPTASSVSPCSSAKRLSALAARPALTLLAVALVVVCLDQLAKAVIASGLGPGQAAGRVDLLGNWFALEYAENRGAAFGLFSGLAPLLAIGSVVVVVVLLAQYVRHPDPALWHTLALGAVAGGAIGNLIDRVRLGYVVDFIAVGPWPNFNLADSAISLGVLALVWGWSRSPDAAPRVETR